MTRIRERGARRREVITEIDDRIPLPKRPYRNSAIFYAVLAVILVAVAYATKGHLIRAVLFAAGFFVIATGWSWWRFRQRLEAQRRAERRAAARGGK